MRIQVRVKPRASRPAVGGRHGDALVVAVREPAIDGRATHACIAAVARAFGVPRAQVSLVTGSTSRTKLLDVEGPPDQVVAERLRELRDGSGQDRT